MYRKWVHCDGVFINLLFLCNSRNALDGILTSFSHILMLGDDCNIKSNWGHLNGDIEGQHWQFIIFWFVKLATKKSHLQGRYAIVIWYEGIGFIICSKKVKHCWTNFCLVGQNRVECKEKCVKTSFSRKIFTKSEKESIFRRIFYIYLVQQDRLCR